MDMERTAAVAVPAREAVLRGFFQRQIVFARQIVAELCQIVILVDQRNVESGRTRMAVDVYKRQSQTGFADGWMPRPCW